MSIYVNKDNSFQLPDTFTRECPHCAAHAQLLPISTPSFEPLERWRPRRVGVAFRCAACNEPRFARLTLRRVESDRIEFSSNLVEVERTRERFPFNYLPRQVEPLFREALECYGADCPNAFASMCRRTLHASVADFGRGSRPRWQELFQETSTIAEVDGHTVTTLEAVLFGADAAIPQVSRDEAAVLIEVIKDMMYQCYVRTSKLRAAVRMRRYFAGEETRNITSLRPRARARAETA